MLRKILWKTALALRGVKAPWAELDGFANLSPSDAQRDLAARLLAQIQYFGNRADALSEWKDAAKIKDASELWDVWHTLPIVTKNDLQTRFHPQKMQEQLGLKGISLSSGGSTGEPTPFLYDAKMRATTFATSLYCQKKMGWQPPSMPLVSLWGSERDIGRSKSLRSKVIHYVYNLIMVDGYELSDKTVDSVLLHIKKHRRIAIYGFTSMLEFVAKRVLERGLTPPPGSVIAAWNGGEMLFESQSEVFKEAFGVPILNFYGGRELSVMAYQPTSNALLSVLRPFQFLEIVDDEGKPVSSGETGRLIWTNTVCRGTPFLRYDIGDVGCYSSDCCDESGIFAIKELHGRSAGLFTLPSGKTINALYWNHLFKDIAEVEQFQVVIKRNGVISLRLKGTPFKASGETLLRQKMANILGDTTVEIQWLDEIPLSPQGKLIQVIKEQ